MEHAGSAQFAAAKQPFCPWLLDQAQRDDDIGRLAKEARSDRRFPRSGGFKEASKYLNSVSASPEMHEALADAETDWLAL